MAHFPPNQPGDTWTSECNTCECDGDSMSVRCEPVKCLEVQSPNCSEPGQQLINKTEGCCTTQSCGQCLCRIEHPSTPQAWFCAEEGINA